MQSFREYSDVKRIIGSAAVRHGCSCNRVYIVFTKISRSPWQMTTSSVQYDNLGHPGLHVEALTRSWVQGYSQSVLSGTTANGYIFYVFQPSMHAHMCKPPPTSVVSDHFPSSRE